MRRSLLYCIFIVLLTACGQSSENDFRIKGRVQNLPESTDVKHKILLLEIPDLMQFSGVDMKSVVDTAEIAEDGSFAFTDSTVVKDSLFYRVLLVEEDSEGTISLNLDMVNENYTVLFLHKKSRLEFETNADQFNHDLSFVKADDINERIRTLYNMQKNNNDKLNAYAKELRSARKDSLEVEKINSIRADMVDLFMKNGELVKSYADTVTDPQLLVYALQGFPFVEDSAYAVGLYDRLNSTIPNSVYTASLNDIIEEKFYTLPIGSYAPEISLEDTEGRVVTLSDFRGKYVLIDFWASWCNPCREENRETVKPLYDKFKSDDFIVLSISLDENRDNWLKAIENDKMDWINISDLQGFSSAVAKAYKVTAIPTTYMIDKQGNIIGKNIRGDKLERFVAERLED